mmetsp:Transcript_117592/g.326921  ORF Transcript_117592/g.326921 Transcript_117592/m.326921 type:complete len:226 (-) Transcript_117592:593-1270(-)
MRRPLDLKAAALGGRVVRDGDHLRRRRHVLAAAAAAATTAGRRWPLAHGPDRHRAVGVAAVVVVVVVHGADAGARCRGLAPQPRANDGVLLRDLEEYLLERDVADAPVGHAHAARVGVQRRHQVGEADVGLEHLVVAVAGERGGDERGGGAEAENEVVDLVALGLVAAQHQLVEVAHGRLEARGRADGAHGAAHEDAHALAQRLCLLHAVGREQHARVLGSRVND